MKTRIHVLVLITASLIAGSLPLLGSVSEAQGVAQVAPRPRPEPQPLPPTPRPVPEPRPGPNPPPPPPPPEA
jgi:hypothetical protein